MHFCTTNAQEERQKYFRKIISFGFENTNTNINIQKVHFRIIFPVSEIFKYDLTVLYHLCLRLW